MLTLFVVKFGVEMTRSRLSEHNRMKIIFFHSEMHLSQSNIARKMKCSQSTVSKVLKQHRQHHNYTKASHHGRKQKLTTTHQKHLNRLIRTNRNMTSTALSRHFNHHDNIQISSRSIRRYRRNTFHPAKEILIHKLTQQHHIERIDFCLTHAHDNFHQIVFSDEAPFVLSHTNNTVWLERGEPIPVREISSSHTSVLVWGGIWYNGRTQLCIVKGTIDYKKYIHILKHYLLPSMPHSNHFLFQQDNARPHIKTEVTLFLRQYGIRQLENWPAQSPDFNPIEHCWSWMLQYIKQFQPTNYNTLVDAVQRAWIAMPQNIIQRHIDHLPTQLQAVYNNGGARLD